MSATTELSATRAESRVEPLGPALSDIASAAPDLVLAATFLTAWLSPASLPGGTVYWLLSLMVLEFIVIHSAGMMGSIALAPGDRLEKVGRLAFLSGIYLLFAIGLSVAFKSIWPFFTLTAQIVNRFTGVLFGQVPSGQERVHLQRSWAVGALLYLGGVGITTILPIPRLGITPEVLAQFHLPSSGLWVSEPWRLLAFGFLYFAGTGLSELVRHRWLPPSGLPKRD